MAHRSSLFDFPERQTTPTRRFASWQRLLPYALLLIVTLTLYGPALYFDFVWDDDYFIRTNYRIQGLSLPRQQAVWTNGYLGHYAPIHHTALAVLYTVSGLNPFGYHLGQLLLHAACVCLLFFLLCRMESPRIALLASLLFSVYPPNIETVAWISETKSTLAFLFFLFSLLFFLRLRERGRWRDGVFCGLFLVLSLLSKINTVVAPAIFLLWDYKQGVLFTRKSLASLAAFFLISAAFVGIHLSSFYASGQVFEGSTYYGGFGVHLMNLPLFVLFYVQMVVFPHPLSAWHMFVVYQTWNWIVAMCWIGMLGLLAFLYRSSRTVQFWGLWLLIFLAPVLQFFPFGIWVADRYLYIPAVGAFVLASKGFFGVADRLTLAWQKVGWEMAMGTVLLLFAWQTHHHLPAWRNNVTLWEATTPTCNTSAYCHAGLGSSLLRAGQIERGVKELIHSVQLRPDPRFLIRLGDAYTLALKDYRQALIAYNMAREQGGREINAAFYSKLARLHIMTENWEEARQAIRAGMEADDRDPSLLVVNGFLEWRQGNLDAARRSLSIALVITGQTSQPAELITNYWGDAADAGKLLADLRTAREANPPAGPATSPRE